MRHYNVNINRFINQDIVYVNSINSGERQLRLWRTKDGYWILLSNTRYRTSV